MNLFIDLFKLQTVKWMVLLTAMLRYSRMLGCISVIEFIKADETSEEKVHDDEGKNEHTNWNQNHQ